MTQKVYVFGDTGGHGLQLFKSLQEIGVDLEKRTIPEGVLIVHLGDLIHRGPLSNTIVGLVEDLILLNPGQWLQVLGNHESQHLKQGISFWACDCNHYTVNTIQGWYDSRTARIAWALEDVVPQRWTDGNRPLGQEELIGSFLATHGGLTFPVWKNLGSPRTATEAAELLVENSDWAMQSVGEAMGMQRFGVVGPVWARAAGEAYNYWEIAARKDGETMPFGQLIGHSAPFYFSKDTWYGNTSMEFRRNSKVLKDQLRTIAFVANSAIICMDPGYGEYLNPQEHPKQPYLRFEIEGATP